MRAKSFGKISLHFSQKMKDLFEAWSLLGLTCPTSASVPVSEPKKLKNTQNIVPLHQFGVGRERFLGYFGPDIFSKHFEDNLKLIQFFERLFAGQKGPKNNTITIHIRFLCVRCNNET